MGISRNYAFGVTTLLSLILRDWYFINQIRYMNARSCKRTMHIHGVHVLSDNVERRELQSTPETNYATVDRIQFSCHNFRSWYYWHDYKSAIRCLQLEVIDLEEDRCILFQSVYKSVHRQLSFSCSVWWLNLLPILSAHFVISTWSIT